MARNLLPIEVPDTYATAVCTKDERHEVAWPPSHKPITSCVVPSCRGALKRVGKGSRPGKREAA